MNSEKKGFFVVFEGIDGSGKTTVSHAVAHQLSAQGHHVVLTKEPGGSTLGTDIRALLNSRTDAIDPKAAALLFF